MIKLLFTIGRKISTHMEQTIPLKYIHDPSAASSVKAVSEVTWESLLSNSSSDLSLQSAKKPSKSENLGEAV